MAIECSDTQVHRPTVKLFGTIDVDRLEELGRLLLQTLGQDLTREGLRDTPKRWARWWQEFLEYQPGNVDVTFESVTTDQMVVVSGIRAWSLCEHHLLPFWVDVSIGYIARDRVLGLSKFARIAQQCAHALQIQERLVDDIANEVSEFVSSPDVAVLAKGTHLCMIMRGIKTPATMTTSVMRGVFFDLPEARAEFLRLIALQ